MRWLDRSTKNRLLAKVLFGVMAPVLVLAACSAVDEAPTVNSDVTPPAELPNWLVRVYPEPDAVMGSISRVEVHHRVTTDGENVRLSIDGTDVTAQAELGREETVGGPGRLVYDPNRPNPLVELDPGDHEATVEHVRLTDIGGQLEVLDSYSWEFSIQ